MPPLYSFQIQGSKSDQIQTLEFMLPCSFSESILFKETLNVLSTILVHHTIPVLILTTHFCYHGIAKCPLPPVWAKLTKSRGDIVNTVPPRLGWLEVRNFLVAMKITGRGQRTTDVFMNLYFRTYLKLDVKVPRNCVWPKRFNLSIKHNDSVHISLI